MTVIDRFTLDTNLLIYAVDHADPVKQVLADRLLRVLYVKRLPLPLQALNVFYRATTSKRLLTSIEATDFIEDALNFVTVASATEEDLFQAIYLHRHHKAQFFDCLLLATAARSGCTTLFSEDFQDGRTYGNITVRNPFALAEADLAALTA